MKGDRILNLVDEPRMMVEEDKYHNLIITFKEEMVYEKGDKISIWSSQISEEARKKTIKDILKMIVSNGSADRSWIIHQLNILYSKITGVNIPKGGELMENVQNQAMGLNPMQREKQKVKSVNINKISNGYLVAPSGIYLANEIVAIYVEKLEDISEVAKTIFDKEY